MALSDPSSHLLAALRVSLHLSIRLTSKSSASVATESSPLLTASVITEISSCPFKLPKGGLTKTPFFLVGEEKEGLSNLDPPSGLGGRRFGVIGDFLVVKGLLEVGGGLETFFFQLASGVGDFGVLCPALGVTELCSRLLLVNTRSSSSKEKCCARLLLSTCMCFSCSFLGPQSMHVSEPLPSDINGITHSGQERSSKVQPSVIFLLISLVAKSRFA
mmetsp:Transcript_8604/g.13264  ORF Transcript_8604/g.13264 Transcript_8604/m.13264 type:complete len:217 (-) Transcript_8604:5688-6338(-)